MHGYVKINPLSMIGASWLNGSWGVLHPQLRLAQHKCHFKFFILMRDNLNKWKKHIYLTENIRILIQCALTRSYNAYLLLCILVSVSSVFEMEKFLMRANPSQNMALCTKVIQLWRWFFLHYSTFSLWFMTAKTFSH